MSTETPIVTREHLAGLRAAQMLWDRSGPAAHFAKALQELIDLAHSAPLPRTGAVPEGYALVPTRMELLPEDIAAIMFHCGGDEEATEIDEQYLAGLLWIGEVQDDDGNKVYGLNIACYECLEEGSTPLVELATTPAPVQQAKDEFEPDSVCEESDGCPTEKAVLQRFWRAHSAAQAEQKPVAEVVQREPYADGSPSPCKSLSWSLVNCEDDLPVGTKLYTTPQPDAGGDITLSNEGAQILAECVGAHAYVLGALVNGRPDLALNEAKKWVDGFMDAGFALAAHDKQPGYMAGAPLLSTAAQDVLAERNRQITAEGWTPAHDDEHACDEIAAFASFYAMPPSAREWDASSTGYGETLGEAIKPVDWQGKTGDRRRELIKAGALILAEIERLDRASAKQAEQEQQP